MSETPEANIKACALLLQKKLDLPENPRFTTREDLASFICPHIQKLLDRDFERLLQLCYRIDLGEERLKRILYQSPVESLAMELSLALIDRQVLKFQTKRKYSAE